MNPFIDSIKQAINKHNARTFALFLIPGNLWMSLFIWRETFKINGTRIISLFDDALISMSYAKNFSQTGSLTWYSGAEKVQGITNPLWTLLLSGFHLISNQSQIVIMLVIFFNLIIINSVSLMVYLILEYLLPKTKDKQKIKVVIAASIPFQYSFMYWTIRGLEVGFLSLILLSTLFLIFKNEKIDFKNFVSISILGFLGVATRFDYFLIHFAIIYFLIYQKKFSFTIVSNLWIKLGLLFPLIFSASVVLVGQKIYYGEYLPNTYYLKVLGFGIESRFIRGFESVLKSYLMPLAFIGISAFIIKKITISEKLKEFFYLSYALVFTTICYVVYVGGDAWEVFGKINRFISVIQPLFVIMIGVGISLVVNNVKFDQKHFKWFLIILSITSLGYGIRLNPLRYNILFPLIVIIFFIILFFLVRSNKIQQKLIFSVFILCIVSSNSLSIASWLQSGAKDGMDASDSQNYLIGLDIQSILKQNGKAAVLLAGAPIYFSNRGGVDLLGKNDSYIARQNPNFTDYVGEWNSTFYPGHNKWNFEYSIGFLKPDMVAQFWGSSSITDFGYTKYCMVNSDRSYFLDPNSNKIYWDKVKVC